jgi:hypothetical protein
MRSLPYLIKRSIRFATRNQRALPDFLIIGAQKAATTSLYAYLAQHPHILRSRPKEIFFFDGGETPRVDTYSKGEAWYRSHFPLRKKLTNQSVTFEASTTYLFNPLVPERIHHMIPQVKLIALLRDPTERAISHYFHEQRKGKETLSLQDALDAEESRLASINGNYKSEEFLRHAYKTRGLYCEQIKRFLDYFPKEQLLILNNDDFAKNPDLTLQEIFEFVGVDPKIKIPCLTRQNVRSGQTQIDPEITQALREFFRPHNQALYDLLGKDFGWD